MFPKLNMAQSFELYKQKKLSGFFEMEDEDYRAAPGLNQSLLKNLLRTPAAYQQALNWDKFAKKSKALELGQLIHLMVLEGEEAFNKKAELAPKSDPRTKIYKEAKKKIEDEGKICVSHTDMDLIRGIAESAKKDHIVQKCLSGGVAEIACFAEHPLGILLKGKLDYINEDTIFDLKTTVSADEDEFNKSARKYRYDLQAAFYLDLANYAAGYEKFKHFAFLAVEKTPPYLFNYFSVTTLDISAARKDYVDLFRVYLRCEEDNEWPGYSSTFKTLDFRSFNERISQ
jgi:hypothetical protein